METTGNLKFYLEPEAVEILSSYNIPYPTNKLAYTPEEAVCIAEEIGYPVVLKIVSNDVIHKSDEGGVAVNLHNAGSVTKAFENIIQAVYKHNPNADIEGILVVKQAADGLEVIIGALDDPTFGKTIMFGLGGIFAEVLKDVVFRIAPLSSEDAEEMIQEIKGYAILKGIRGETPKDTKALIELLLSVSEIITENSEISELDLNPVRVYEKGLLVLDARILAYR